MDLRLIQSLLGHRSIATPQPATAPHHQRWSAIHTAIALKRLLSGLSSCAGWEGVMILLPNCEAVTRATWNAAMSPNCCESSQALQAMRRCRRPSKRPVGGCNVLDCEHTIKDPPFLRPSQLPALPARMKANSGLKRNEPSCYLCSIS